MGRPAFSWRVTPGDHGTEGSEDPPTMVTAPSGAITTHRINQFAETPRGCVGPTLSRSCLTNMTPYNGYSTTQPRQKSRHQTKHNGKVTTIETIHITVAQDRYRGGPTRTGSDPTSPPPSPSNRSDLRLAIRIANRNRTKLSNLKHLLGPEKNNRQENT